MKVSAITTTTTYYYCYYYLLLLATTTTTATIRVVIRSARRLRSHVVGFSPLDALRPLVDFASA